MFTVVIAEKNFIDAVKGKNSLFFQNFIHNEEIAFCEWNTEGQTFTESVPDLVSLVGRHKLWKAVIVLPKNGEAEEYTAVNPFDVADTTKILECKRRKDQLEKDSENVLFNNNSADEKELKKAWHTYYDELLALKKECYEDMSKKPLQRLTTYLCFKKDNYYDYSGKNKLKSGQPDRTDETVQPQNNNWIKKEEIYQWLSSEYALYQQKTNDGDDITEEDVKEEIIERCELLKTAVDKVRFNQLSAEEYLDIREQFESVPQTKSRLEEQFGRNLAVVKEELRRQMTKGQETIDVYLPSEVYCVAARTTEVPFFNPDLAWENRVSTEYSDFAERNFYFDKMRFLVFDLLPKTHKGHRTDYLRFLYAVLLIATNEVPTGILSARKLYRINSENIEQPLCELATAYCKKLEKTHDVLDKEIEKILEDLPGMFTDTEAEVRYFQDKAIMCPFERDFVEDGLFVNERSYVSILGRVDHPADKWEADCKLSEKTFKKLIKQPRRAIKRGVDTMKDLSEVSVADAGRMTKFQQDDLREITENRENDMASMNIPDLFDFAPYKRRLDQKSKEVRHFAESTMSKPTIFALSGVCIGLFLLCFLPFVFNNRNNIETGFMSTVFALAFLVVFALVLLVSLYFLHRPLKKSIRGYNDEMRGLLQEIKTAVDTIGCYLTKMAGVRRGNAILKYIGNAVDSRSKDIVIRQKHQGDILRKKAYLLEEYGEYIDENLFGDELDIAPYNYNFSKNTVYEYPAPYPSGDYKSMEFLIAGNRVPVPTEFAIRLNLIMEEIYD